MGIKSQKQGQKGMILVLVAIGIVVFISLAAIVVDIGILYLNKVEMANASDAAALAGIQELPESPALAHNIAISYALQNGKPEDIASAVVSNNDHTLTVNINRTVPLYFAKVFGMTEKMMNAQVGAIISPVTAINNIVPFGVVSTNFQFGVLYQLKAGIGNGFDGNYAALALGGTGATNYKNNIINGYPDTLTVGQWVATETTDMTTPTEQGLNYRIGLDINSNAQTVQKSSPRIATVPVINALSVDESSEVQIVGFAAFFLEGENSNDNENYIYGRFLQIVAPAIRIYNNENYGALTEKIIGGYGLYGSKLISDDS